MSSLTIVCALMSVGNLVLAIRNAKQRPYIGIFSGFASGVAATAVYVSVRFPFLLS